MKPGGEPTRGEIDQLTGPVLLEFGASWCGHCLALRPHIDNELNRFPQFQHVRIEDGKGQPLGRSFRITLWPTLIFLNDGQIIDRLVRPDSNQLQLAMERLAAPEHKSSADST